MTQSMVEPPTLQAPRQCHRFVFGDTTKDGVLSSWNGHRPSNSAPCRFNSTPKRSTSRSSATSFFSRSNSVSGILAMPNRLLPQTR